MAVLGKTQFIFSWYKNSSILTNWTQTHNLTRKQYKSLSVFWIGKANQYNDIVIQCFKYQNTICFFCCSYKIILTDMFHKYSLVTPSISAEVWYKALYFRHLEKHFKQALSHQAELFFAQVFWLLQIDGRQTNELMSVISEHAALRPANRVEKICCRQH